MHRQSLPQFDPQPTKFPHGEYLNAFILMHYSSREYSNRSNFLNDLLYLPDCFPARFHGFGAGYVFRMGRFREIRGGSNIQRNETRRKEEKFVETIKGELMGKKGSIGFHL